jgi:hypothetical protein
MVVDQVSVDGSLPVLLYQYQEPFTELPPVVQLFTIECHPLGGVSVCDVLAASSNCATQISFGGNVCGIVSVMLEVEVEL